MFHRQPTCLVRGERSAQIIWESQSQSQGSARARVKREGRLRSDMSECKEAVGRARERDESLPAGESRLSEDL